MGQVTLYLDRETEARIKAAAKAEKKSLSRRVADALRKQGAREWPASVLRLAGAWKDFPSAEEIRAGAGTDVKREHDRVRTGRGPGPGRLAPVGPMRQLDARGVA